MNQQVEDANKSEAFYKLLESLGYEKINKLKASNFDYLFGIRDTQQLFDWLLANINADCRIHNEQMSEFKEKCLRGQVIWDLNKLEKMHSIINSNRANSENDNSDSDLSEDGGELYENDDEDDGNDNDDDIDALRRDIEFAEKELQLLVTQNDFHKNFGANLKENLISIKSKAAHEENLKSKLSDKENKLKLNVKTISQILSKQLIEFQTKYGNEDKLNQFYLNDLNEFELELDNYISNEKMILEKIKQLLSLEVNVVDMLSNNMNKFSLDTNSTEDLIVNDLSKIFKILSKNNATSIFNLFTFKLDYEIVKSHLNEMNDIIERKNGSLLEFTREQLKNNPQLCNDLETRVKQTEALTDSLKTKCKILSDEITLVIDCLATLKSTNLVNIDMNRKFLEYNLFSHKQDKLIRFFNLQQTRIDYLKYLENIKLNDIDYLKQLFSELLSDNNNSLIPLLMMSSSQTQNSSQNNKQINKNNNDSFLAPSLSSTMINNKNNYAQMSTNSFMSSPNRYLQNKSKFFTNPYTDFQISSTSRLMNVILESNMQDDPLMHIMNQFLISVLTRFESDDYNQQIVKLKTPISINFYDNFDNFVHLFECIHSAFLNNNSNAKRSINGQLFKIIDRSIEYLYDKDDSGNHNLSKIFIKQTKGLDERLRKLREESDELQDAFAYKIFHKFNNYKSLLTSNKLVDLKRNLFLIFYTNPKQIDFIVEQLNAMKPS